MSFTSDARAELARESCVEKCCARAELAAALLVSGGISVRFGGNHRYALEITSGDASVARHYFALLKRHFGVIPQLRQRKSESLRNAVRFQLLIPDECAQALLQECAVYDSSAPFGLRSAPPAALVNYDCCKKSFLKSSFMLAGSVNDPERGYQLEYSAQTQQFADYIISILNHFDIFAKCTSRKSKFVVYLKKGDEVSDALALMGAAQATLALQGVRVKKELSGRVNRQMNCDESNTDRVAEAAVRQNEDIALIDARLGLDSLPQALRELAELRRADGEATLTQLGEELDPPLGKSGVNARMRKLHAIAEALRRGESGVE